MCVVLMALLRRPQWDLLGAPGSLLGRAGWCANPVHSWFTNTEFFSALRAKLDFRITHRRQERNCP